MLNSKDECKLNYTKILLPDGTSTQRLSASEFSYV